MSSRVVMNNLLVAIILFEMILCGCGANKATNEENNLFVTSEDWIELKKDITEEDYILAKEDEIITICIEEDYYDEIQNTIGAWKMLYPNVNAKIIKIPSDYDKAQIVLTMIVLNLLLIGTIGIIVYKIDLPSALLPVDNIFDWHYYLKEWRIINAF